MFEFIWVNILPWIGLAFAVSIIGAGLYLLYCEVYAIIRVYRPYYFLKLCYYNAFKERKANKIIRATFESSNQNYDQLKKQLNYKVGNSKWYLNRAKSKYFKMMYKLQFNMWEYTLNEFEKEYNPNNISQ